MQIADNGTPLEYVTNHRDMSPDVLDAVEEDNNNVGQSAKHELWSAILTFTSMFNLLLFALCPFRNSARATLHPPQDTRRVFSDALKCPHVRTQLCYYGTVSSVLGSIDNI